MKSRDVTLQAGVPQVVNLGFSSFFLIMESADFTIKVRFLNNAIAVGYDEVENVGRGFWYTPQPGELFDAVELTAVNTQTVKIAASRGRGNIGFPQLSASNVQVTNAPGAPVPVTAPNPLPIEPRQAATVTEQTPVAVTTTVASLLGANAARKGFRVRNVGPARIAIGGAGVTMANAAIVLEVGDVWSESDAAPAAWSVIGDAASTAAVQVF